jgi:hypothetical protein
MLDDYRKALEDLDKDDVLDQTMHSLWRLVEISN